MNYWLMYKSPPNLGVAIAIYFYYSVNGPTGTENLRPNQLLQISTSVLSGFVGPLWLKIPVDFNCKTPLHIRRENLLVTKTTYQRFFLGVLKKSFRCHVCFRKGGLYMRYIYIDIMINIMLKSHGFVPWCLVSADWWCLNSNFHRWLMRLSSAIPSTKWSKSFGLVQEV